MNVTSNNTMLIEFLNITNTFIVYIEGLSSLSQSIIGSFIFYVLVIITRFLLNLFKSTGTSAVEFWGKSRLLKYYLHKNMIKSTENLYFVVYGNFTILQEFLNHLSKGILIIVFYLGVESLLEREFFSFFMYFIAFNSFYEAYDWIKDHSSERSIANVSEALKNDFFNTFGRQKNNSPCSEIDKEQDQ